MNRQNTEYWFFNCAQNSIFPTVISAKLRLLRSAIMRTATKVCRKECHLSLDLTNKPSASRRMQNIRPPREASGHVVYQNSPGHFAPRKIFPKINTAQNLGCSGTWRPFGEGRLSPSKGKCGEDTCPIGGRVIVQWGRMSNYPLRTIGQQLKYVGLE